MGAFCVSPWVADRRLPAVSAVSRHANGGTRAERDGVPGQADRRGGERKRERRRRLSWRRSRGAQAARHRSKHDASPAPAGPPGLHAAGRLGRRTGVRGAAPFPPRRSGRWPLQAATQIARGARAPLPFGDSLKKGGARGGESRGEGRGGGNGGQGVPRGPGVDRAVTVALSRARWLRARSPRCCRRRRFPRWSAVRRAPGASRDGQCSPRSRVRAEGARRAAR